MHFALLRLVLFVFFIPLLTRLPYIGTLDLPSFSFPLQGSTHQKH